MKGRFIQVVFILLLCCSCLISWGQEKRKLDSLTSLLHNYQQKDSARFRIYGELCWLYATTRSETDIAKMYADSIYYLALALNDPRGEASAHFYYGCIGRFEGNFTEALKHLGLFIQYHKQQGDSSRVARALFQVGSVYLQMDEAEPGLKALYRALAIHETQSNLSDANYVLNAIGIVLKKAGNYDEAIQVYERVLKTDSLNSDVLMNLGNVYSITKRYDKTLEYYRKALDIDRAIGQEWAVAYDLEAIGGLFNDLQMHDSALLYHQQSLAIRERLPDRREKAISLGQLGLTETYRTNFSKAENLLMKALDIADATRSRSLKKDIYENLALLYERKNDLRQSYQFYKKYVVLKDSLLNEASIKQLNELKTRYATDRKDQQIELLSKENELSLKERERLSVVKNSVITGIVLVALLGGLIADVLSQRLKNQKMLEAKNSEIREANFKSQLSELKMKALQAQINPHFIFNCMNSINQMILEGHNDRASLYLSKFSRLIRLILENSESTEVSLKDEISLLEAYIQLEELRFNRRIGYRLSTAKDLDPENIFLPFMVLQPFVENAIWHGLRPKGQNGDGRIDISIAQNDGLLICQIEDNGIGRDKSNQLQSKTVWKTKSMGLKITEERLDLLNKEFKKKLINITDLKDAQGQALGTRVEVCIPMV